MTHFPQRLSYHRHFSVLPIFAAIIACGSDPGRAGEMNEPSTGGESSLGSGGFFELGTGGALGSGGTSVASGGTASGTGGAGTGGETSDPPVWACDDCPEPPPTVTDWIDQHGETLSLLDYDGHVAVYVDDNVNKTDAAWVRQFISDSVAYMKQHYDQECHYGNDRLHVFLHQGTHGGGTISSYWDAFSSYRNAVDGGSDTWVQSLENVNIDILSHELAHIVEGSSNCTHESPGFGVWGDSKWAEIFQYDLYLGLGRTADAEKVHERFSTNGDPWFQEFYLPIYEAYGGVQVLDGFFKLLSEHFPTHQITKEGGGEYPRYSRRANLGELVHFYSGAAGADVSSIAAEAFEDFSQEEFEQAQVDFPGVTY